MLQTSHGCAQPSSAKRITVTGCSQHLPTGFLLVPCCNCRDYRDRPRSELCAPRCCANTAESPPDTSVSAYADSTFPWSQLEHFPSPTGFPLCTPCQEPALSMATPSGPWDHRRCMEQAFPKNRGALTLVFQRSLGTRVLLHPPALWSTRSTHPGSLPVAGSAGWPRSWCGARGRRWRCQSQPRGCSCSEWISPRSSASKETLSTSASWPRVKLGFERSPGPRAAESALLRTRIVTAKL